MYKTENSAFPYEPGAKHYTGVIPEHASFLFRWSCLATNTSARKYLRWLTSFEPRRSLHKACDGLLALPDESSTKRETARRAPLLLFELSCLLLLRFAARAFLELLFHEPPRSTPSQIFPTHPSRIVHEDRSPMRLS